MILSATPWGNQSVNAFAPSHGAADRESAVEQSRLALVRIPVSIVVSGFLFAYVGLWQGAAWLSAVLLIEAGLGHARVRLAAGDLRYDAAKVAGICMLSVCWVVHALMLWGQTAEIARIATLMDLFTIALYGAIEGRRDWRVLVALMAPPLTALLVILLHLIWTQANPAVAIIASLATLGSCGTIAAIALAMLVSDRKLSQAHAETQRERDTLEERVIARTAELARATKEAQAASLAKSQFLATMSHELRTPLNAVIGYAELIQEDEQTGAAQREDAGRIGTAGRHLLSLVNDILDLSKIDAGKMEVELSKTDVPALVARVAETVAPLAAKSGNRLSVRIGDGVGEVMTDQRKLFQCAVNLAGNACKFTRGGHVDIEARLQGESFVLAISDTGCGMDREKLALVFEPFVQLDSGPARAHDGSGLGLSISRRLARLLGGDIEIVSARGQGTTASIVLPLRS